MGRYRITQIEDYLTRYAEKYLDLFSAFDKDFRLRSEL
jgi:hypothetical protein